MVQTRVTPLVGRSTTDSERKCQWIKRLMDCIAPLHTHDAGRVSPRKGSF